MPPPNYVVVINNLPRRTRHAAQEGGGYSNIFIHTLARTIFRGSKISISVCFGFFREMNIFGGMKILLIFCILGVYHIIGLYLRVTSMHFMVFSFGQVHNGGYFWGLLKFQIFFRYLKFLILFG